MHILKILKGLLRRAIYVCQISILLVWLLLVFVSMNNIYASMFVFRNPEFHFMFPMLYFITMSGTRPFCLDFLKQTFLRSRSFTCNNFAMDVTGVSFDIVSIYQLFKSYLTYSFRRHPFSTPWKQKTVKFSDVLGA